MLSDVQERTEIFSARRVAWATCLPVFHYYKELQVASYKLQVTSHKLHVPPKKH